MRTGPLADHIQQLANAAISQQESMSEPEDIVIPGRSQRWMDRVINGDDDPEVQGHLRFHRKQREIRTLNDGAYVPSRTEFIRGPSQWASQSRSDTS